MYDVTSAFGANNLDATGATDNTTKFNAILGGSSTPALTAPFTLYFPTGTYKFSSQPNAIPNNVRIFGDGKDQTVINGARTAVDSSAVWSVAGKSNVVIEHLKLSTNDDANAASQGLLMSGCSNVVLRDVKIENVFSAGLRAATNAQVFAYDCEWMNIFRHVAASGVSGNFRASTFNGCHWHDMNQTATTQHCAYLNTAGLGNSPQTTSFVGCLFETWASGIPVELHGDDGTNFDVPSFVISGCVFAGSESSICIQPTHLSGLDIVGNTFYSCNAISMIGTTSFSIVGNTHYITTNSGYSFVVLNSCANGMISGNTVTTPTGSSFAGTLIALADCTDMTIQGNQALGVMRGVALQSSTVGATTRITVRNNKFSKPTGWTVIGGGAHYFYGNPSTFYGVSVDGGCTQLQVLDNECFGLNYELFFTQFISVGQANQARFRSASWDAPVTSVFGYQNSAVPTNLQQFTAGYVAIVPGASGAAYTTIGS